MGQTMKTNSTVMKIAQTALFAALCYVIFTYLQIKIPMPGGDATSIHLGNAFCVLAAGAVSNRKVTDSIVLRPSFNLLSSVTYASGSGTSSDPIRIN